MARFEQYRDAYRANWDALQIRPEREQAAARTAKTLLAGKARYQVVEARAGVPWWFVGLCHYREGAFNFGTYLGNGQSLGRRTTIVPIGRGPFFGNTAFEDGADDALTIQGFVNAADWSIERTAYRLEGFNGYGYHGKGVNSPYLYGGSTLYGPPQAKAGKYVADHDFDADFIDTQLGTLVVLKALCALDASIGFSAPGAAAPHEEALEHGVAWAQGAINELGADPKLTVDGKLGPKTMRMVHRFQEENGLASTGLLDAATIAAIEKHLAAPVAVAPPVRPRPDIPAPHPLGQDITDVLRRIFG